MIKWHKVMWYSRWGSIIFFLVILPILTFYVGNQYGRTQELMMVAPAQFYSPPAVVEQPTVAFPLSEKLIKQLNGMARVGDGFECPPGDDGGTCWSELLYRGDLNDDGYEDAIISSGSCGASCGQNIVVYLNQEGEQLKGLLFNEKLGIKSSGADKTEIGDLSVKYKVISIELRNVEDEDYVIHQYKIENDAIVEIKA